MKPCDAEGIAREYLTGKRLEHSLSVARLAVSMGVALGLPAEDEDALYIAGVLHDIAKGLDGERQCELAERWHSENGLAPPSHNIALWHAPAAAWLIRRTRALRFCSAARWA